MTKREVGRPYHAVVIADREKGAQDNNDDSVGGCVGRYPYPILRVLRLKFVPCYRKLTNRKFYF